MSEFGDGVSVYPLMDQWRFEVSESGVSGTRVFLENKGQLSGAITTNLPDIGDSWSTAYQYVTVKTILVTYPSTEDCGRMFTVNYNGSPSIQSAQISSNDLPVSIDVGGEFVAFEPYEYNDNGNKVNFSWHWSADGKDVKEPIYRRQAIANIRFTKVVPNAEDFTKLSMDFVGYVNSGTFFGFGPERVMYEGCSLYQFKNKLGFNRWKAELHFSVRQVTQKVINDGWNFLLRPDKDAPIRWDKPLDQDGDSLYDTQDFDYLLSSFPLPDDEDYYNNFPEN